jgi:hypothetical protein
MSGKYGEPIVNIAGAAKNVSERNDLVSIELMTVSHLHARGEDRLRRFPIKCANSKCVTR